MNKIMDFIKIHKGAISSCLGFIMAFPINLYFIVQFYRGIEINRDNLEQIIIINMVAMIWYIMPSKIEIAGKIINIKIED